MGKGTEAENWREYEWKENRGSSMPAPLSKNVKAKLGEERGERAEILS